MILMSVEPQICVVILRGLITYSLNSLERISAGSMLVVMYCLKTLVADQNPDSLLGKIEHKASV